MTFTSYKKLYTSQSTDHNHAITVGGRTYYTE